MYVTVSPSINKQTPLSTETKENNIRGTFGHTTSIPVLNIILILG